MEISTSSVDYIMLAIKERFHLSIQNSRILLEILFVIGAWLVQGPIGMGTICIMLLFGPILQACMKLLNPVLIKLGVLSKESRPIGIKVRKIILKNK